MQIAPACYYVQNPHINPLLMCLILIAHRVHPRLPLVVAANRDEFHARPSASSHFWQEPVGMLAGRDLQAGGTWLGVNRSGCFAAITNVSEIHAEGHWLSRGDLVRQFLDSATPATVFADTIAPQHYRGFNLLMWDGHALTYSSNRSLAETLRPGIYGLANAGLNESRFKVWRGSRAMQAALSGAQKKNGNLVDSLFSLLSDPTPSTTPEPRRIPGMSDATQRALSACFITGDEYGTRASSVVLLGPDECLFSERVYAPRGMLLGQSQHTLALSTASANPQC